MLTLAETFLADAGKLPERATIRVSCKDSDLELFYFHNNPRINNKEVMH